MSKLKLGIISSSSPETSYGGIGPFIKNLDPFLRDAFELTYIRLPDKMQEKGIVPTRLKFLCHLLLNKRKLSRFDVILSHYPEGSFVASFTSTPFIHILHGNTNALASPRYWYGKYFRWVYDIFESRIARKASLQYTVGIEKEGFKKLLNPVRHLTPVKDDNERKGFIFSGRLEKVKNIDLIIRAYARLPADVKTLHPLFIAGSGSLENELKALARELGLTDCVVFTGNMPNEELIRLVSTKKLLLMASSTEGFPMAIAEALSVGLPIISTDVGDIPRIVKSGQNGLLLPPGFAPDDYAACILKILRNYTSYSENALISSQVFDAKIIGFEIITELKKIAS